MPLQLIFSKGGDVNILYCSTHACELGGVKFPVHIQHLVMINDIMRRRNGPSAMCVALWLFIALFVLQFVNYDWNIFNFHFFNDGEPHMEFRGPIKPFTDKYNIGPPPVAKNLPYSTLKPRPWEMKGDTSNDYIHPPRVTEVHLRIMVITYNRAESMLRLLNSLNKVDYLDDRVVLEIWVDRSKDGVIDKKTFGTARNFSFEKGFKTVHQQDKHVGIYGQWIDTWQPTADSKEIAVIFEDDITVSPFFYRYLKNVHARYDHRPEVNGYSLQGISIKHGGAGGNLHAPDDHVVFLYPIVGSWGFSPKKENWIGFQRWGKQIACGLCGTFTMHIVKKNGHFIPNFPHNAGMTINWKEKGLHFAKTLKNTDPLVMEWDPRLDNLPEEPVHLDANGKIVKY
ncbi:unnamed protein product [Mytilus coruscus]|uniref:Uncharacterized protein n=1 Tax=Mytilus coruscus TaxID=42192 RepID=A0A6J8DC74_MYTCO|nr:unnamed protein product [Mytilus coruscus]